MDKDHCGKGAEGTLTSQALVEGACGWNWEQNTRQREQKAGKG